MRGSMVTRSVSAVALLVSLGISNPTSAQQQGEVRHIVSSCFSACDLSTGSNETVEVLLPDGTSVIFSPGSKGRVSRDADGKVIIDIEQGLFRVAGGTRNDSLPILISTPHSEMRLSDGSAIIAVAAEATRTHLLHGQELIVAGAGRTQRLYRPGFQIFASSTRASSPRRMQTSEVIADLQGLSTGLTTGLRPRVTSGRVAPQVGSQSSVPQLASLDTEEDGSELGERTDQLVRSDLDDIEPNFGEGNGGSNDDGVVTPVSFGDPGAGIPGGLPSATIGDGLSVVPSNTESNTQFNREYTFIQNVPDLANGQGTFEPIGSSTNSVISSPAGLATGSWLIASSQDTSGNLNFPGRFRSVNGADKLTWFYSAPNQYDTWGYRAFDYELVGNGGISGDLFFGGLGARPRDTEWTTTVENIDYLDPVAGSTRRFLFFDTSSIRVDNGSTITRDFPGVGSREVLVYREYTGRTGLPTPDGVVLDRYNLEVDFDQDDPAEAGFIDFRDGGVSISIGAVGTGTASTDGSLESTSSIFTILNNNRGGGNFLLTEVTPAISFDFDLNSICSQSSLCEFGSGRTREEAVADVERNIRVWLERVAEAEGGEVIFKGLETSLFVDFDESNPRPPNSIASLGGDPIVIPSAIITLEDAPYRITLAHGDLGSPDFTDYLASRDIDLSYPRTTNRFFVAGDVDGLRSVTEVLGPGKAPVTRTFLREETWTDLGPVTPDQLSDSGVIVIEANGPRLGDDKISHPILHADIGLENIAEGQVSTVSATIGQLDHNIRPNTQGSVVEGNIVAYTVGTSRAGSSTLVANGESRSSAVGGGNLNLDGTARPVGYFVLENSGTIINQVTAENDPSNLNQRFELPGGTETALNGDTNTFGLQRIGVAYSRTRNLPGPPPSNFVLSDRTIGFATAMYETLSSDGQTVERTRFKLPYDGVAPLAVSTSNMQFGAPSETAFTFPLVIDGPEGPIEFNSSAYVSGLEFGATTFDLGETDNNDTNLALISGEVGIGSAEGNSNIAEALDNKFQTTTNVNIPAPQSSVHTQWGFFMGDQSLAGGTAHIHAGAFAAGDRIDMSNLTMAKTTAMYEGHAVGTVVDDGASRLVVGTYTDNFNFRNNQGSFEMDFDQRLYSGDTTSFNAGAGGLLYGGIGVDVAGTHSATVSGEFVHNSMSPIDSDGLVPGGLIGSFDITNGGGYEATGSFGAVMTGSN